MLTYAFDILREEKYSTIGEEDFDFIGDMFAELLNQAISNQLKRGLSKEYILRKDALHTPKGRLNISDSIKTMSMTNNKIVCEYDEFSENILVNQIIKTTAFYLIKSKDVGKEFKSKLKKNLLFFDNVDLLELSEINFNTIKINRKNRNYELIMNLCYLILEGLLMNDQGGSVKFKKHLDEDHLYNLFERFVLNYYKRHYVFLKPKATKIDWLSASDSLNSLALLPSMYTDIVLENQTEVLIIDTKFYSKELTKNYKKASLRSKNLYQIYSYVSTMQLKTDKKVSGMLLYAKTNDASNLNEELVINNQKFKFRNLDLNQDFQYIRENLNEIANSLN